MEKVINQEVLRKVNEEVKIERYLVWRHRRFGQVLRYEGVELCLRR